MKTRVVSFLLTMSLLSCLLGYAEEDNYVENDWPLWKLVYFDIAYGKGATANADIYMIDAGFSEEEWREATQIAVCKALEKEIISQEYANSVNYENAIWEIRLEKVKRNVSLNDIGIISARMISMFGITIGWNCLQNHFFEGCRITS